MSKGGSGQRGFGRPSFGSGGGGMFGGGMGGGMNPGMGQFNGMGMRTGGNDMETEGPMSLGAAPAQSETTQPIGGNPDFSSAPMMMPGQPLGASARGAANAVPQQQAVGDPYHDYTPQQPTGPIAQNSQPFIPGGPQAMADPYRDYGSQTAQAPQQTGGSRTVSPFGMKPMMQPQQQWQPSYGGAAPRPFMGQPQQRMSSPYYQQGPQMPQGGGMGGGQNIQAFLASLFRGR